MQNVIHSNYLIMVAQYLVVIYVILRFYCLHMYTPSRNWHYYFVHGNNTHSQVSRNCIVCTISTQHTEAAWESNCKLISILHILHTDVSKGSTSQLEAIVKAAQTTQRKLPREKRAKHSTKSGIPRVLCKIVRTVYVSFDISIQYYIELSAHCTRLKKIWIT